MSSAKSQEFWSGFSVPIFKIECKKKTVNIFHGYTVNYAYILPKSKTHPYQRLCRSERLCCMGDNKSINGTSFSIALCQLNYYVVHGDVMTWKRFLAPVPLSIFRSNSKFDEKSKHSSVKYTRPITAIFCTRHDSVTVVTCAKYRCDRSSIFETKAFWIFIEFQIRSKYA